jgi:hypothetical protein
MGIFKKMKKIKKATDYSYIVISSEGSVSVDLKTVMDSTTAKMTIESAKRLINADKEPVSA